MKVVGSHGRHYTSLKKVFDRSSHTVMTFPQFRSLDVFHAIGRLREDEDYNFLTPKNNPPIFPQHGDAASFPSLPNIL